MSTLWLMVVLMTLFVGGLILLLLEIFVIPGFGIAGVGGLATIGASIVYAFMNLSMEMAVMFSMSSVIVSTIVIWISLKTLPKTALGKSLILSTEQKEDEGYDASDKSIQTLLGKTGEVMSPLRPSGSVLIEGGRVDVVSDGAFIQKGHKVKVVKIDGNRVVVEPADAVAESIEENVEPKETEAKD